MSKGNEQVSKAVAADQATKPEQGGKELTAKELATVTGGEAPRDAASGLPTGKRLHKPYE